MLDFSKDGDIDPVETQEWLEALDLGRQLRRV